MGQVRPLAGVHVDRERDGSLVSRSKPGSVIHDRQAVVDRAVRMVKQKEVVTIDGATITLHADTICLHGDTPGAADLARAVRRGLEDAGIQIAALKG